jgi:NAD(P) transhydrogenase subunit alpha
MVRPPILLLGILMIGATALGASAIRRDAPRELPTSTLSVQTPPVQTASPATADQPAVEHAVQTIDYWSMLFVFVLATFIGLGVIMRVSRLLHTPLMSLTNAISAIAVVGSIIVTGANYPTEIRFLGAVALFASMTNIVSGFLITDRMLKMFKRPDDGGRK